jgi:PadR family transcriptional regulator PadR
LGKGSEIPAVSDAKWLTQIKKGLLELCILNLLEQESTYGYEIVKRLTSIPGLVITEGTVYPLLSRLKREGVISSTMVESPHGPVRRNYVLTEHGREHLGRLNESWLAISEAIGELVSGKAKSTSRGKQK